MPPVTLKARFSALPAPFSIEIDVPGAADADQVVAVCGMLAAAHGILASREASFPPIMFQP
jgi:hypothetical protein